MIFVVFCSRSGNGLSDPSVELKMGKKISVAYDRFVLKGNRNIGEVFPKLLAVDEKDLFLQYSCLCLILHSRKSSEKEVGRVLFML